MTGMETLMAQPMERHTIRPSGKLPIEFDGFLAAKAGGPEEDGTLAKQWHEIIVFRTKSERFVVELRYISARAPQDSFTEAFVGSAQEVIEYLENRDPMKGVRPFPPAERFVPMQTMFEFALSNKFREIVTDIFADLSEISPEFVREV